MGQTCSNSLGPGSCSPSSCPAQRQQSQVPASGCSAGTVPLPGQLLNIGVPSPERGLLSPRLQRTPGLRMVRSAAGLTERGPLLPCFPLGSGGFSQGGAGAGVDTPQASAHPTVPFCPPLPLPSPSPDPTCRALRKAERAVTCWATCPCLDAHGGFFPCSDPFSHPRCWLLCSSGEMHPRPPPAFPLPQTVESQSS